MKDKKYCKVRDHCHYTGEYRGAAHSIYNLKYSVPKSIPIVFHNGSRRKHCKIQNPFRVPIEKEVTRIDKNGKVITKSISYTLQFIDSARFMASSLSNLVNNLSEGIHGIKY